MNKPINYIAIALTTDCNYTCFYCKESGESINSELKGTWDFNRLKDFIKVAYDMGLTTFRITGGEPTMVEYLPDLIRYIMDLGENTKIRLNTNGYNLEDMVDLIEMYKDRMDIVISVDSINEYVNGIHYQKYLSPKLERLSKELVKRQISTRFNVVVTRYNVNEVKELIEKALELGVNIKILDLIVRNEYWGNEKKLFGKEAIKFGDASYQNLDSIIQYLEEKSDKSIDRYSISNSKGIPMSGYFFGNQWVQVKDSSKGTLYSEECNECNFYDSCKEGVFSPFLSVGEILHLSGCLNEKLYYYLKDKSEDEIRLAFETIIRLFENTELKKSLMAIQKEQVKL